jgi:hypothetical protein
MSRVANSAAHFAIRSARETRYRQHPVRSELWCRAYTGRSQTRAELNRTPADGSWAGIWDAETLSTRPSTGRSHGVEKRCVIEDGGGWQAQSEGYTFSCVIEARVWSAAAEG